MGTLHRFIHNVTTHTRSLLLLSTSLEISLSFLSTMLQAFGFRCSSKTYYGMALLLCCVAQVSASAWAEQNPTRNIAATARVVCLTRAGAHEALDEAEADLAAAEAALAAAQLALDEAEAQRVLNNTNQCNDNTNQRNVWVALVNDHRAAIEWLGQLEIARAKMEPQWSSSPVSTPDTEERANHDPDTEEKANDDTSMSPTELSNFTRAMYKIPRESRLKYAHAVRQGRMTLEEVCDIFITAMERIPMAYHGEFARTVLQCMDVGMTLKEACEIASKELGVNFD